VVGIGGVFRAIASWPQRLLVTTALSVRVSEVVEGVVVWKN